MNIRAHIELRAVTTWDTSGIGPWASGYGNDHFETFQVPTPVPTAHPPGLKNPKKVTSPGDIYKDAKEGKKKRKRRGKPKDLDYVMRKTLNQGHPLMVRHAHGGDPGQWNPSQIADL